jgi:hypothetical protein
LAVIHVGSDQATRSLVKSLNKFLEAVKTCFLELGAERKTPSNANGAKRRCHGAAPDRIFQKVVQFLADNEAKVEIWNKEKQIWFDAMMLAQGYRPGNFKPSFDNG